MEKHELSKIDFEMIDDAFKATPALVPAIRDWSPQALDALFGVVQDATAMAVEVSHREGFLIGIAMASTLTAFSIASADTAPFLSSSTILWSASYISGARAIR